MWYNELTAMGLYRIMLNLTVISCLCLLCRHFKNARSIRFCLNKYAHLFCSVRTFTERPSAKNKYAQRCIQENQITNRSFEIKTHQRWMQFCEVILPIASKLSIFNIYYITELFILQSIRRLEKTVRLTGFYFQHCHTYDVGLSASFFPYSTVLQLLFFSNMQIMIYSFQLISCKLFVIPCGPSATALPAKCNNVLLLQQFAFKSIQHSAQENFSFFFPSW